MSHVMEKNGKENWYGGISRNFHQNCLSQSSRKLTQISENTLESFFCVLLTSNTSALIIVYHYNHYLTTIYHGQVLLGFITVFLL